MGRSVKIRDNTYAGVPAVAIKDATDTTQEVIFYDTSDANNIAASDVAAGKPYYSSTGKGQGTMIDNGTVNYEIETASQQKTIDAGKHSGLGKAFIKATEVAKIISANIKSGITILGVTGKNTVVDTEEASSTAAGAATIYKNLYAWVNGVRVKGELDPPIITQDQQGVLHIE